MMYLKIMGSEDMVDHDPCKPHTIVSVRSYGTGVAVVGGELCIHYTTTTGEKESSRVFSTIYVMNADGKTINTITPMPGVPQSLS